MRFGSAGIDDEQFLATVSDCSYPADRFHHGDHLRLGWLLLKKMPFHEACDTAASMIQSLGRHNGKANLYHETVTKAWMHLVACHLESDFQAFVAGHQTKLSKDVLMTYWKESTLNGAEARVRWVPPDLKALPCRPVNEA